MMSASTPEGAKLTKVAWVVLTVFAFTPAGLVMLFDDWGVKVFGLPEFVLLFGAVFILSIIFGLGCLLRTVYELKGN